MTSEMPIFATNEKVLCYHGPLIYEAKIIQVRTENGRQQYLVHYKGWKQTWDEWVPEDRALKFNEANLAAQKALQQKTSANQAASKAQAKAPVAGSSARNARDKGGQRGQKRAHDEENGPRQPQMKLTVPESLKCQLVDDWEAVTKNQSTVHIPRDPTVHKILEDFEKYVLEKKPPSLKDPDVLVRTVVNGIQIYFDRSLGSQLLYRFERPQYAGIREKYFTGQHVHVEETPEMSGLYGAEHLLRMLVALPQMVAQASLDAESIGHLRDYVNELLQYMADPERKDAFFEKEYEIHSIQYQNLSRS
ncbi:MRG-domain-containing protein [Hymenopellis radicata]|nr:MRG-domain-containing protein [Hymenopellis radicata]